MLFSVLHASRGRPSKCFEVVNHTFSTAKNLDNFEYILVIGEDEPNIYQYARLAKEIKHSNFRMTLMSLNSPGKVLTSVEKFNYAAKVSSGGVILGTEDDYYLPKDWDEIVLNELNARFNENWRQKEWVIWSNDGDIRGWNPARYPDGYITHPILSRPYLLRRGDLIYPEYHHYYSDVDFTEQALKDKVEIIDLRAKFKCVHKHYQNTGEPKDLTTQLSEFWAAKDQELFFKRWINK